MTTITLAPMEASWKARLRKINATLGGEAECCIHLMGGRYSSNEVSVTAYPYGIGGGDAKYFHAGSVEDGLAAAEAWVATQSTVRRDATIRKLALDIMDLTDQHGRCTEKMLRDRRHAAADIASYRDLACARASEIAGNAPFAVICEEATHA